MHNVFVEFADITFTSKGHLFLVLNAIDPKNLPICCSGGR